MDASTDIAAILAPIDRRAAADRLLAFLVQRSGARGGAIIAIRPDRLTPYVVRELELRRLAGIQDLWVSGRGVIESGESILGREYVLAPISTEDAVSALLFLDAPQSFEPRASAPFLAAIGRAMQTPIGGDAEPMTLSYEEGGKEELLAALHRSEWNLARAARMMRCSRRTVYLRMARYEIARKKVPKSVRRTRPQP
jgi:hypothetical protein